nr:LysR family transcriptional regulator [uncultured Sphingomonas sp.]
MEWSDIRVFLQVAREGTMVAATRALRMDHSTISRRIARLERGTDLQLFERAGRRLTLTTEGERLAAAAEKLESIIFREVLSLASERNRIAGPVRLGTTEDFGAHFLARRLDAITEIHPGLEIELVALPRAFSLAAREVDLVIALDRPATGDIRFKKLIDVEFGVYATAAYFADRPRPSTLQALADETWCGFIKELLFTDELDVFPGNLDPARIKYRTTNLTVQLGAAMSGYALAALPCFVARDQPGLERLLPDEARFERTYWMAVHEDLANLPRVRALMSVVETLVGQERALFRPSAVPHASPIVLAEQERRAPQAMALEAEGA